MKHVKATEEARALIAEVAIARLKKPKVPTDAELIAQTGLSKAYIHRLMKQVKVSLKIGNTPPTASDPQTASESAMTCQQGSQAG